MFRLRDIRLSVRPEIDVDSKRQLAIAGKHIQPDTSLNLTASRPPFGLKVEGRCEHNNVIRNQRKKNENQKENLIDFDLIGSIT
jgi:hypothetical protein